MKLNLKKEGNGLDHSAERDQDSDLPGLDEGSDYKFKFRDSQEL